MLKRITCLMAAVLLVISSGAPAMAATPQEGWFIAGIETLDGLDYYVIDNKRNMDPWLVDFYSQRIPLDFSKIEYGSHEAGLTGYFNEVLLSQMYYKGYSDYSWRIDEDWVVKIWGGSPTPNKKYKVLIFDRTQLPTVAYNNSVDDSNSVGGYDQIFSDWSLQQNTDACIPFSWDKTTGAEFSNANVNRWTYWQVGNFQMASIYGLPTRICGSDINDICVTFTYGRGPEDPGYNEDEADDLYHAQIAIQWLCPVDKAPSGMAVGDYWPKVRPLEVEMQEAMNEYEEAMLANSQIKQPSDINTMFGQLGGMQEDGLGALDFGEDEATVLPGVISIIQPVITFLFPFFGLVLILLIFANKGIHG